MLAQERLEAIASLVSRRQKLSVSELQTELGASSATLRRDLAQLEAQGRVVRVHGAVVHPTFFRGEPSWAQKQRSASAAKRAIARVAAELVPARAHVWVDAGTTALELGALLLGRRDLTILTPSIPLAARALESGEGAKIVLIGGEVRAISGALVGGFALEWTQRLRADWSFVGASGLHPEEGASTTELNEAALKSALLERGEKRVLLCDSGKWNRPATVNFAGWNDFDFWISDGQPESEALRASGIEVLVAG